MKGMDQGMDHGKPLVSPPSKNGGENSKTTTMTSLVSDGHGRFVDGKCLGDFCNRPTSTLPFCNFRLQCGNFGPFNYKF